MGSARSVPSLILPLLLVCSLAACAGNVRQPQVPDNSLLLPAEAMVEKAEAAGAAQLAPGALREAHRRLGVAQGLLYEAAIQGRGINKTESRRVERLVEEATVDARLALALTKQEAVARKSLELREFAEGNEVSQ